MKLKDFDVHQLKPETKYILAVERHLTIQEFQAFKKELDQWLQGTDISENSFLFIQNATVVELPSKPKKEKKDAKAKLRSA